MLGDDEDDLEALEEITDGPDDEDEDGEGPGEDSGQEVREGEAENEPGPDEEEDEFGRQKRVDPEPAPTSRQRRSQSHWQKRETELAATRKRAEEAEARANQLAAEHQRTEAQRQQAQQQDRERRRELMTPEERTAEDVTELRAQINFQRQMDAFYRGDAEDRATYQAKATVNKVYKRHEATVEAELKKARASGTNLSREQILRYVIGDEALKMADRSASSQPTRRKPVSKPVNSRSNDTSTPGKRGSSSDREALKKRLANIPL